MKKLSFFSLLFFAAVITKAQSLEEIGKVMEKEQYAAAKVSIEKYIADPKNAQSPEAWYYKGRIYNSLSKDTTVSKTDAYNYKITATSPATPMLCISFDGHFFASIRHSADCVEYKI